MRRHQATCIALSSAFVVGLTAAVVLGLTDGLDTAVRGAVNGWATPWLTQLFSAVTTLGAGEVVLGLTGAGVAALLVVGRRREALHLAAIMAAAFVVNNAIKYAVARERPEAFFGETPTSFSFASGHALYAGCFYGAVGALIAARLPEAWQRAAVLAAALAVAGIVGLSRVYLGVHYPTDVLAGFALAALILCIGGAARGP